MALNNFRKNFLGRIRHRSHGNDFIPLNDMFSYGRTGNTIHIHLVPKDLHDLKNSLSKEEFNKFIGNKLEDFLGKLQSIAKDDPSVKNIFAVSPIFFHEDWRKFHKDLGFDPVKEILLDENDGMPHEQKLMFLNMFKGKRVFYTNMPRDRFLSMKYNLLPSDEKNKPREL